MSVLTLNYGNWIRKKNLAILSILMLISFLLLFLPWGIAFRVFSLILFCALLEMGAPDYPTTAQLDVLMKAAALHAEVGAYKWDGGALLIRLSVPPHSVASVTLSN
jgi:hypothetical protein